MVGLLGVLGSTVAALRAARSAAASSTSAGCRVIPAISVPAAGVILGLRVSLAATISVMHIGASTTLLMTLAAPLAPARTPPSPSSACLP